MAKALRSNQRDGYVFEAYAEASSKVESLKRMAKTMEADAQRYPALDELHRKARNTRQQAYDRLEPYEEICAELYDTRGMDQKELKQLRASRDKLVGEIFVRLYHIELATNAARKVLGG